MRLFIKRMKIFRDLSTVLPSAYRKSIATIGIFDGVHIGHQAVLGRVIRRARRLGEKSLVITFDPHPAVILNPRNAPPMIMSVAHRLRILEGIGFDICWVMHFTKQMAQKEAWQFVRDFLVAKLGISEIWVGKEFRFGRINLGTVELLRVLGKRYGFSVHQITPIQSGKQKISSTEIRRLIEKGKLSKARRLLGRPVSILGTVIRGESLGGKIGFPTANLDPHHEAIPPRGVYTVRVVLDGKCYRGVVNIGIRPTIKRKRKREITIEAHLIDFSGNLYGKDIELLFVKKLRNEKKFHSLKMLACQIQRDIQKAKQILKR